MSELRLGQDKKYLEDKARHEGLLVFLPESNEVFLDMDRVFGTAQENQEVLGYIAKMTTNTDECSGSFNPAGITVISALATKSNGGNTHIYLRMSRDLTNLERVILQVCLGSDPVKELFSFIQMRAFGPWEVDCECPVALFENPAMAAKVTAWRASTSR